MSAAFDALYTPMFASAAIPPMEAVLMTAPPCSPIHIFAASPVHCTGAHRFTSKALVNRSWSWSMIGPSRGLFPRC
jgi:hypothetical protein